MLAAVTAHNGPAMVPASVPVLIKLYADRRLYQPHSGRYVTFDDLAARARAGTPIIVRDARSGADVTRLVLSASLLSSRPTEH
jgi:polyhydroxyalkanoate synthesis regulator protein